MTYRSFQELEAVLPQYNRDAILYRVCKDNVDWILDNHHLYNMNEIAHRCGIARRLLIQFFHLCGISTEFIYSAKYATPRVQGELAGRARENGYRVEGMTIHHGAHANTYLERQAVGVGYRVIDEYGNELLMKDIQRPEYIAIEYSNAIDIEQNPVQAPKESKAVEVKRVRKVGDTKPRAMTVIRKRSSEGKKKVLKEVEHDVSVKAVDIGADTSTKRVTTKVTE